MKKILLSFVFITSMMHLAYSGSLSRSLIKVLDQASAKLKNNPDCLDKIDDIISKTGLEIKDTVKQIEMLIPKEVRQDVERIIKIQINEAVPTIEKYVQGMGNLTIQQIKTRLGTRNMATLNQIITTSTKNITYHVTDPQTRSSFNKLGIQLESTLQPARDAFEELQKTLTAF